MLRARGLGEWRGRTLMSCIPEARLWKTSLLSRRRSYTRFVLP